MNKTLLRQASKFKDNKPTNKQIEILYKLASKYQQSNEIFFIDVKYGKSPIITNELLFFEFLSHECMRSIVSFEDIEILLEKGDSRKENIEKSGDSKNNYIKVFDKVVLFQFGDNNPVVYTSHHGINVNGKILAIENGETFLNIHPIMSKFGYKQFVYLGGYPNTSTKKFLQNQDVVFFLDYDIEAIKIYDSIKCKEKEFFRHPDIEKYFKNNGNQKLYLKQRASLPQIHTELQWLIELINTYSTVVEQEIIE